MNPSPGSRRRNTPVRAGLEVGYASPESGEARRGGRLPVWAT